MQLIRALIALMFVLAGVVFGALNRELVQLDFFFGLIEARLGLLLLATFLVGALIGGVVVTMFVVWPAHRRSVGKSSSGMSGYKQP